MASLSLSLWGKGNIRSFPGRKAHPCIHGDSLEELLLPPGTRGFSTPPASRSPHMLWGFEGVVKIAGVYVLVANMLYCMEVKVLSPGFV